MMRVSSRQLPIVALSTRAARHIARLTLGRAFRVALSKSQTARELRRHLPVARQLAQAGRFIDAGRWAILTARHKRKSIRIKLYGRWVVVRTATPDVRVALSCFGGEFDELMQAVPKLRHGFIIDGGGYIGTAAIVFANAFPEATIVTVEPSDDNYAVLKQNVLSYPNIHPIKRALASRSGQRTLRNRGTGDWGFTVVDRPRDNSESRSIGTVDCITIEEIMERFSVAGVDILKLDIEGGEHTVLDESNGWIQRTGAICIELHDRIVEGCSEVYRRVTAGRDNSKMKGEKFLSISWSLFGDHDPTR